MYWTLGIISYLNNKSNKEHKEAISQEDTVNFEINIIEFLIQVTKGVIP